MPGLETNQPSHPAEQQVRRHFEIVQALLGPLGLGAIATNEGLVVAISPKLAGLLGYHAEELLGAPAANFFDGNWIDASDKTCNKGFFCNAVARDGRPIPVHVRSCRMEPHETTFVAIVTSAEEVTSTPPEPSESIVRLQKLQNLGALSHGIAHDFNNLLLGILGNADLALLESPPSSPSMGYLIDIKTTAERAAELSQQLFSFSDKDPQEHLPVSLNDIVTGMQQLIDVATGQRGVLRLDLSSSLPHIMAVPSQMQQVILSLTTNASEAVEMGSGTIKLSTRIVEPSHEFLANMELPATSAFVLLEIEDNGRGVPKDAAQHMFEPFFSTKGAGRGLGLFASRSIIRAHQGDLTLLPAKDRGTIARIALPSAPLSKAPSVRPSRSTATWKGSGTVLVVDDEHFVRTIVRQMLETIGFNVETAYDGQDAVNLVRRNPTGVQLVLLDLTMPHMNGESAFREIRHVAPEVKVVLMSGYRAKDVAARFETNAPDGFIQKPFTTQDIMETIRSVLEP